MITAATAAAVMVEVRTCGSGNDSGSRRYAAHTNTYMDIHTYIYIYTHTYIYTYVHIYICIYAYIELQQK